MSRLATTAEKRRLSKESVNLIETMGFDAQALVEDKKDGFSITNPLLLNIGQVLKKALVPEMFDAELPFWKKVARNLDITVEDMSAPELLMVLNTPAYAGSVAIVLGQGVDNLPVDDYLDAAWGFCDAVANAI